MTDQPTSGFYADVRLFFSPAQEDEETVRKSAEQVAEQVVSSGAYFIRGLERAEVVQVSRPMRVFAPEHDPDETPVALRPEEIPDV